MRNKSLDVLRGIAVLLVLSAHAKLPTNFGWVGVDLFFVLSGFLISGLLFTEYKKRSAINLRRFFLRRGLKIYPAFYVLLLFTLIYQWRYHLLAPWQWYIYELAYIQNYTPIIWDHTWSLAVEEHFYVLLPLFLLLLIHRNSQHRDPFQLIPRAFLFLAAACLAIRLVCSHWVHFSDVSSWRWLYATTHSRIDSLFFGVFLGYLLHFQPAYLERIFSSTRSRMLLALASATFLAPCLFLPINSSFMLTVGLTLLYLGFGIVLLLSLKRQHTRSPVRQSLSAVGSVLAYVGVYSYSIYLWHLPVLVLGMHIFPRFLHVRMGILSGVFVYFLLSIVCGILMAKLVEFPVLRFRDRFFPSSSNSYQEAERGIPPDGLSVGQPSPS